MTDKERCDLLLEQIRTLKEIARAWRDAAEAWRHSFLAEEDKSAAVEARLAERTRNERLLAESRGKRDLEAMGDGE